LQYPTFLFPGKSQYTTDPAPKGLTIYRRISSIEPWNWIRTGFRLRKSAPDIIIIRYWLSVMSPAIGTICRIARRHKGTKIIALVDNMLPHEKRPGDKLFARYLVGSADGFLTMSQSVLDDIAIFDQKKPRICCPHPLYDNYGKITSREEALKHLELDPSFRYLLFFGFIRNYKGLDLLLEALAKVPFDQFPVKLLIAGEFYGDEPRYLNLINQLNLFDRVILYDDYIPEEQVSLFFGAADMLVLPYRSATQSGVTQIGYLFDTPMLVTRVGGLPEIVPDGKAGYVVNPNPEAITNAIKDFFSNNRLSFFEENVRKEKKRFSWENLTKAFSSIADQIKS
jgi:glycosyltransferase involved in cell wall biosynthesis